MGSSRTTTVVLLAATDTHPGLVHTGHDHGLGEVFPNLEIIDVEGDHHSLVEGHNAPELGHLILTRLGAARTTSTPGGSAPEPLGRLRSNADANNVTDTVNGAGHRSVPGSASVTASTTHDADTAPMLGPTSTGTCRPGSMSRRPRSVCDRRSTCARRRHGRHRSQCAGARASGGRRSQHRGQPRCDQRVRRQRRVRRLGHPSDHRRHGQAPFADASFDTVLVAFHGFDYLVDPAVRAQAIADLARVVAPAGT
ncbi:MAG: hypothetical protein R2710_27895 [Acidimicrobiales bacterium]